MDKLKNSKQLKISEMFPKNSEKVQKKGTSKSNGKRENLLNMVDYLVLSKRLDKTTSEDICLFFEKKYNCVSCDKNISDSQETISCFNCKKVLHLDCLKKFSKQSKDSLYFTCKFCRSERIYLKKDIYYNCYCQSFYEVEKTPSFDPNLIPHGCGSTCGEPVCTHLNCTIPCHPGPHVICQEIVQVCCPCGKIKKEYVCGQEKQENSCNDICGKRMDCGIHLCSNNCHNGICICKECNDKPKNRDPKIINLKGQIKLYGASCELDKDVVYCGRRVMGVWNLKHSIWANPFKIKDFKDIYEVLKSFEEYARNNEKIMNNLQHLVGKKLACWCHPEPCHTNILIKLMKEKNLIQ